MKYVSGRSARKSDGRAVVCETLEGRQFLSAAFPSVGVSLDSGVLTIVGTRLDDNIRVVQSTGKNGKTFLTVTARKLSQVFRVKGIDKVVVRGGAGNDSLQLTGEDITAKVNADVKVEGGSDGTLSFSPVGPFDVDADLDGGAGNDQLTAGEGDDTLSGGDGNDAMNAGNGANIISGGDGNDNIHGGKDADSIDGGTGDDRLDGNGYTVLAVGNTGNGKTFSTTLSTTANPNGSAIDTIVGGAGNDTFYSGDDAGEFVDKDPGEVLSDDLVIGTHVVSGI